MKIKAWEVYANKNDKKTKIFIRSVYLFLLIFSLTSLTVSAEDSNIESKCLSINVGNYIKGVQGERQKIVEVFADGSFITENVVDEKNIYTLCEHNFQRCSELKYIGRKESSTTNVCYYNLYSAEYKCSKCGYKKTMTKWQPVQHNYVNGKCTKCGKSN